MGPAGFSKAIAIAHLVRSEAEKGWPGNDTLQGCCAECSYRLKSLLHQHGLRSAQFVVGGVEAFNQEPYEDDHAWVEWRGWILDITATQFWKVPRVYVVRTNSNRYLAHRKGVDAVRRVTMVWSYGCTRWRIQPLGYERAHA